MVNFDDYWKDFCYREIAWWEDVYAEKLKEGKTEYCNYMLHDKRSAFRQVIDFLYEKYLIEYVPIGLRKRSETEPLKQLELEF